MVGHSVVDGGGPSAFNPSECRQPKSNETVCLGSAATLCRTLDTKMAAAATRIWETTTPNMIIDLVAKMEDVHG
jgi:hypothetical protein